MRSDHGGNLRALSDSAGVPPDAILDFSANINPLGLSPHVAAAIRDAIPTVEHYPDPESYHLRAALARHHGLDVDQILPGCGSTELIYLVARALQPKRALVVVPAFSEYEAALELAGAELERFVLKEEDGFLPRPEALVPRLPGHDLLVLANPGNPAGGLILLDRVAEIVKASLGRSVTVLLDEAFIDFVEEASAKRLISSFANLLVLRSLTKFYALPGLRVGYLIGAPDLLGRLFRFKEPWTVNTLGEAAALAALEDREYQKRSVELIPEWRRKLAAELEALSGSLKVFPGDANYLLVKLLTLSLDAPTLSAWLLKEGIAIRDCSSFAGLGPSFFRIAVRTPEENHRLVTALKDIFSR